MKNMVKRLPLIKKPERVCKGFIFGKKHGETFPIENSYKAHTSHEIVNFDICVPMQTPSIGGCNCFLTFIDDFTRKRWIYFLK